VKAYITADEHYIN